MTHAAFSAARVRLPDAPAVAAGVGAAVWLSSTGEVETLPLGVAAESNRRRHAVPMVCHRKAVARRLGTSWFPAFDLLELFAFVRPARFCVPTVRGLADALSLPVPETLEQEAETLFACARALMAELTASPRDDGLRVAWTMASGNWSWAAVVLTALGAPGVSPNGKMPWPG